LALAILIAGLVSLANPSGWRTLVQPLEYFTVWRHEAIYQTIGELAPIPWDRHVWDGLPVWLALVVLGAIWRWRGGTRAKHGSGFDIVQAVLLLVCLPQALSTQRFLATAVLALAPFAARDAGDWCSRRRWPSALQSPARRVTLAALACVLLVVPTMTLPLVGFGYGFNTTLYPERAADWMQQHDVRGRSFNVFWFGGYLLYRFYPDPGRLPFFDIHQAGTKDDRFLGSWALEDLTSWKELDRRHRFDWVMLPASMAGEPDLNDFLDADSTWALVFADDAATLWLRRDGSCAGQAAAQGYRYMPAGTVALAALGQAAARNAEVMREAEAEFARAMRSSPHNGHAHTLQGHVEMFKRNFEAARAHYDEAARLQPSDPDIRPWQGLARLRSGDPEAALDALGRRDEAIRRLRRSVERHPELSEARDSLKSWGAGD
jgi:tetratricopeptide (TPR) repeat protein